jgi:tetratricopeptide (TPR) repeat protein
MDLDPDQITKLNQLIRSNEFGAAYEQISRWVNQDSIDPKLLNLQAKLAIKLGDFKQAGISLLTMGLKSPINADDCFNTAWQLKNLKRYKEALEVYERCLALNVDHPEDVHVNMGIIWADHLGDEAKAIIAFQAAIQLNPLSINAYINLGNLYDETGQLDLAGENYKRALSHMPGAYECLARLSHTQSIAEKGHPIILKMQDGLNDSKATPFEKECLSFALGSIFDSLEEYDQAFSYFQSANEHGLSYGKAYDRKSVELQFEAIKEVFSSFSPSEQPITSPAPVFICGMFRSGSTLIEQVLNGHPKITSLGELPFFDQLGRSSLSPFPQGTDALSSTEINEIRDAYLTQPQVAAVNTPILTDKRPDNFIYLGLIKQIFPRAKIIHTQRDFRDMALSIYFTQFGDSQGYARRLESIRHYYDQYTSLMHHWKTIFGTDILDICYQTFISDNELTTRNLLTHLDLDWSPACLDFHTHTNRVKTASYKQIRRPLYRSSVGRWKNYLTNLQNIA